MKHIWIQISTSVALVSLSGLAQAANHGCERRAAEIERQLSYAQQHHNEHRQRGLTRALENVRAHCTDEGLRTEQLAEIAEQRREIESLQAERSRREAEGREDKVRKLDRKISREEAELRELEQELRELDAGA